ncbi:MAG: hypothetical protein R2837_03625 [Aliarcobacter sp.]
MLLVVAFLYFHSVERFFNPTQIAYKEAIVIAILGLVVNLTKLVIKRRPSPSS